jgi:basic membrane lipoprotein Med (substrate-binding protein (PBP1-ABC) superfamily)
MTKSVLDHTWKPADIRYGLKDGCVKLASFGLAVSPAVQQEAKTVLQNITEGKLVIFKGPIKDREGNVRIPSGKVADNNYLERIDWLVPGVEGALPH